MRSFFIGRMLLGQKGQLAFVTPQPRGDRGWHGTSNAQAKQKGSPQLHFLGATYASTLEFMERRFQDIDIVCCNPDGLGPSDIAVLGKSDLGLLLEGDHRLPDLERPQQARLNEERQERRRGPTAALEMPSVPCRDHRMTKKSAANSHSTTSAKPVPISSGRGPLMATRVMRCDGCPNFWK